MAKRTNGISYAAAARGLGRSAPAHVQEEGAHLPDRDAPGNPQENENINDRLNQEAVGISQENLVNILQDRSCDATSSSVVAEEETHHQYETEYRQTRDDIPWPSFSNPSLPSDVYVSSHQSPQGVMVVPQTIYDANSPYCSHTPTLPYQGTNYQGTVYFSQPVLSLNPLPVAQTQMYDPCQMIQYSQGYAVNSPVYNGYQPPAYVYSGQSAVAQPPTMYPVHSCSTYSMQGSEYSTQPQSSSNYPNISPTPIYQTQAADYQSPTSSFFLPLDPVYPSTPLSKIQRSPVFQTPPHLGIPVSYFHSSQSTPGSGYAGVTVTLPTVPRNSDKNMVVPPASGHMDGWNSAIEKLDREYQIRDKIDLIINGRWQVMTKINVGSYGAIYDAFDLQDPQIHVAVKFETSAVEDSHIRYEHEVYKVCSNGPRSMKEKPLGFPQVYWVGEEYGYKIMVMEILGPSLENIFAYCSNQFRHESIYQLGTQMLDRVEHLHSRGFIHRDLKPENFLMGVGENESICYLIDFGLARRYRYRDGESLTHVPYRKGKNLVGTAKYASLNSHNGIELSRRDDLESLAYILLEFITGDLPWKEPRNRARFRTKQQSYNRIRAMKEQMDWDKVCPALSQWIADVRALEFADKPEYDKFRGYLRDYLKSDKHMVMNITSRLRGVRLRDRNGDSQNRRICAENAHDSDEASSSAAAVVTDVQYVPRKFEWLERRDSSPSEKYTFESLYRWTLPPGVEPVLPDNHKTSMSFGYGFGEGGFA